MLPDSAAVSCQQSVYTKFSTGPAVKNNQPTLRAAIEDAFADVPMRGFEHSERSHGRIVLQHAQVITNTGQVSTEGWPGCQRLGRVVSPRVTGNDRQVLETRYYISSAALDHQALYAAARNHWGIENNLHGCLDVIFREDASTVCTDHGPQNLAVIRKITLNLLHQDSAHPKASFKKRRKIAGWDDDERMRVLGITPL